jgi:hypothetical protein
MAGTLARVPAESFMDRGSAGNESVRGVVHRLHFEMPDMQGLVICLDIIGLMVRFSQLAGRIRGDEGDDEVGVHCRAGGAAYHRCSPYPRRRHQCLTEEIPCVGDNKDM